MNVQRHAQPDHPLFQWFRGLQAAKYRCSEEELAVLKKCRGRMARYSFEGAVVGGGVAWIVGHHLKSSFISKLVVTAGIACAGAMLAHAFGLAPCLEDILALDGSQFQRELVAVLQKERSFAPPLRKVIDKYYYLEPVYDDSNQGAPFIRLRRRLVSGEDQPRFGTWDMHGDTGQKLETHVQKDGSLQNEVWSKPFIDPLDMLPWAHDSPITFASASGVQERLSGKKWKSQMTPVERRAYHRMRYLRWKQKIQEAHEA